MSKKHALLMVGILLMWGTASSLSSLDSFAQLGGNQTQQKIIKGDRPFGPSFETFVVPGSVGGYGVYEERMSNVFAPGEDIILYIEPVGFSYQAMDPSLAKNETLYLMNFTSDVLISDNSGNVLAGFQDLPISQILSHHQNKEINLVITLSQSTPFPDGDYSLKYTVHDVSSGDNFDVSKEISINPSQVILEKGGSQANTE